MQLGPQAWQHVFFAQDSCAYFQVLSLHLYWIRDHSIPFDRHYQVCVCVCERADKKKRHPPTFISLLHHDSSTRILNHPFAKCATIVPANSGKHPCSSGYNIISSRCTKSSLRADLVACFVCVPNPRLVAKTAIKGSHS